jgi:hypothetical protein
MSRVYKFRGRRIDNDEWAYGSLIEGLFFRCPIGKPKEPLSYIVNIDDDDVDFCCWQDLDDDYGFYEVDPATVSHSTNIFDKHNKEDWVSDIVKATVGPFIYYREIFQSEGGAYCINLPTIHTTSGQTAIMLWTCEHENVGNIHEHPELLKEGNGCEQ